MESILDFYAQTNTPFLHANGRSGTAFLINKMKPQAGQSILEIGFGTGQTLIELSCRYEDLRLFGLERSPKMMAAAKKRFRFAGIDSESFVQMPADLHCPFEDGSFDVVYCESVLAILEPRALEKIWQEVFRLLRPGGSFYFNESLFRPEISSENIHTINQQCMEWFGIPQASEAYPYPADWQALARKNGFVMLECKSLHGIPASLPIKLDTRLLRSRLFSAWGKLRSWFSTPLRRHKKQIGQQIALLADASPFLEGVFFHCRKGE